MKYRSLRCLAAMLATALVMANPVVADDLPSLMKRVQEFSDKGNYAKAIDELGWVRKELEKLHFKKIEDFFPDEVLGYTGSEFKPNSAMGISNLERSYTKAGSTIGLSLTGSSANGGPLGGLAGFGKMAAMMGAQQGVNSFRIAGRTAVLNEQGKPELSVFLDSGSVLQLSGATGDELKKVAEALDVEKLDDYLRGQS